MFGHLDQTTVAATLRVNYTLTPRLSIQFYGAPFVSAGDYGPFKELVDGRAPAYADRYAPFAYAGNPDFNYKSFRTTNVLRWEYRPGSTLFVVWQQGREEVDRCRPLPLRARLHRRVPRGRPQRLPGQDGALAQLLARAHRARR